MPGALVISLDFELHWGVRDHTTVERYRENLLGVREAIPSMLDLFGRRSIAATWATVGFLFAETKKDLEKHFPRLLPTYDDPKLSPYEAMSEVGADETSDPFHFAPTLLRQIAKTPRQEIGTHTFSHFYCLERGQTAEQFDADLEAAASIGRAFGEGETMRSIVFPRNQSNDAYQDVMRRRGIRAYRSNGPHWAYRAEARETPARRAFRLLDAYLPASGSRAAARPTARPREDELVDVPASAFLRPYTPRLRHLDAVRFRRLAFAMTRAAETGRIFHLWWHPHNFGRHPRASMAFLERLVGHYEMLRTRHGMESLTMAEASGATEARPLRRDSPSPGGALDR